MKDLYVHMSKLEDNSLFGNEFIKILLEQQFYTWQIVVKIFLPYCVYFSICLYYFSVYIPVTICDSFLCEDNDGSSTGIWLRILILVFGVVFLSIEFAQMLILKFSYFDDFWNYLYVGSIIWNILLVLEHSIQIFDVTYDRLCGANAMGVVAQWAMMYYWMRLHPGLAFFVTFLTEVVKDIGPFMLMFAICILMFGNAIFVLNLT